MGISLPEYTSPLGADSFGISNYDIILKCKGLSASRYDIILECSGFSASSYEYFLLLARPGMVIIMSTKL